MNSDFTQRMVEIDGTLTRIASDIPVAKRWASLYDTQRRLDETRARLRELAWLVGQKKFTVAVLRRMRTVRTLDGKVIAKYREMLKLSAK